MSSSPNAVQLVFSLVLAALLGGALVLVADLPARVAGAGAGVLLVVLVAVFVAVNRSARRR